MTRNEFTVHKLTDYGMQKSEAIASAFTEFLDDLERVCGQDGREMAIVRTKLEEACFFAKKAMASRDSNQEV